jgi:CheY-like chemotaxis protein
MNRERILIIEDDRDLCEELSELLRDHGYTVDAAQDGNEGKRLLDGAAYAVVLLDLKLPGIDGSELLRHIALSSTARTIVITGKPMQSDLQEELGSEKTLEQAVLELAEGYIEKPFKIDVLLDLISGVAGAGGGCTQ